MFILGLAKNICDRNTTWIYTGMITYTLNTYPLKEFDITDTHYNNFIGIIKMLKRRNNVAPRPKT